MKTTTGGVPSAIMVLSPYGIRRSVYLFPMKSKSVVSRYTFRLLATVFTEWHSMFGCPSFCTTTPALFMKHYARFHKISSDRFAISNGLQRCRIGLVLILRSALVWQRSRKIVSFTEEVTPPQVSRKYLGNISEKATHPCRRLVQQRKLTFMTARRYFT